MASKLLTLMLLSIMMTLFKTGLPLTTTTTSTISASPSYFASSPSPSEALTPDVTPLLPSPGPDSVESPSGSSIIPTIPSNPSPPNPDSVLAPQPLLASSPNGLLMPEPDSYSVHLGTFTGSVFVGVFLALWLMQI